MRIDINCDGSADQLFTGRDKTHFYVAVERESLNYDPSDELGETPDGFMRSSKCFGLKLVAGECDSFHLFWNHAANALSWWRL